MNHYYEIIKACVKVIAEMEHTRIEKSRLHRVLEDDLKRTHQHLRSAEAALVEKDKEIEKLKAQFAQQEPDRQRTP